jgi:hypothetical protein
MNVSDSEVVASILAKDGYTPWRARGGGPGAVEHLQHPGEGGVHGDAAHQRDEQPEGRNKELKVGVLGCMAERMREDLLVKKKVVDLVVGPDAYRTLPELLDEVGRRAESRERAAEPGGDLRRDRAGAPGQQRGNGLSSPSCGAATTCAPSAWCPSPGAGSAAAMPIASWRNAASSVAQRLQGSDAVGAERGFVQIPLERGQNPSAKSLPQGA